MYASGNLIYMPTRLHTVIRQYGSTLFGNPILSSGNPILMAILIQSLGYPALSIGNPIHMAILMAILIQSLGIQSLWQSLSNP